MVKKGLREAWAKPQIPKLVLKHSGIAFGNCARKLARALPCKGNCLAPPIHGWEMSILHPGHSGKGTRHPSTSFCSRVGTEPRRSAGPKPESPRVSVGLGCSGHVEPITHGTEGRRMHPRLVRNDAGSMWRGGQWKGKRGKRSRWLCLCCPGRLRAGIQQMGHGMPKLCRDRVLLGEVDVCGGVCTTCPRPPALRPRALLSPSQSPPTPHSLCSCVPSIDPAAGSGAALAPSTAPGTAGFTKLGSITGAAANPPGCGSGNRP